VKTDFIFFDLLKHQPWRKINMLLLLWLVLAVLNYWLLRSGFITDSPRYFPISVFKGPTIHFSGLPYLLAFLTLVFLSLRIASNTPARYFILIGIAFILLGNLGQGDFETGFLKPFYESNNQYYHDALKISDWQNWLSTFNINQENLLTHTRTHPPFAVLLHYGILKASGGSLSVLSLVFILLTSSSLFIVWHVCRVLGLPYTKCNFLILIFSVIPAVNIYSAVSLDGIILTTSSLFLLGLALIVNRQSTYKGGILFLILGFTFTNLLTYGGIFLVGVGILVGLWELVLNRRLNLIIVLMIVGMIFIGLCIVFDVAFSYNHIYGFLTASRIENQAGFMGLSNPLNYLMHRIEAISEIALFLSFGLLAVFIYNIKRSLNNYKYDINALSLSGVIVLLFMFLGGAYRTGETARACLFIYPYLLLIFSTENLHRIKGFFLLAGLQTAVMQLIGGYFW
jgi:hypothetical protein